MGEGTPSPVISGGGLEMGNSIAPTLEEGRGTRFVSATHYCSSGRAGREAHVSSSPHCSDAG
jgi:hypothetical protein